MIKKLFLVSVMAGALTLGAVQANAQRGFKDDPSGANGRYQIFKDKKGNIWRLDTRSGNMVACKFVDGTMLCGSEDEAVKRGDTSYQEYQKEQRRKRAQERRDKQLEREQELAFVERVMTMVMDFIRSMAAMERETNGNSY